MGQIINNVIISLVLAPVVYYLAKKRKGNEWVWVGVTFLLSSFIGFWVSIIPIVYLFFCENKETKILRGQAEQGDTNAQYNLGVYLMSKNSYEEAQNWFDKASAQGHTDAQSKSNECRIKIEEKVAAKAAREAEAAAEKELKKQRIIETIPHYHIYEKAVFVLKQSGYEIENTVFKKGLIQSFVKRDSINYGMLFAVKPPSQFESLIENKTEVGSTGDYYIMVQVCKDTLNSRHKGKVCWPEHSLVGGFTGGHPMYRYNEEWLEVLQSVIG